MSPTLKPLKTRLTKHGKILNDLIRDSVQWTSYTPPVLPSQEETVDNLGAKKKILQQRIVNLRNSKESLEKVIASFEEAYEKMEEEDRTREEEAYESYTEAAWESITSAEDTLGKLAEKEVELNITLDNLGQVEERRIRLQEASNIRGISSRESTQSSPAPSMPTHLQTLLPRLQLPKFGGKRQEWNSFWAIFKAGIDEQPISQMMKLNYLLQSLVGEARQTAAQFEVVEENYQVVVNFLKKKYGSDSLIVEDLLAQLEQIHAEGPSTKQQTNLLEKVTALLMQLSTKGQDINHRLILNMVLRKFNTDIQTKALEKRENLEDMRGWTWTTLQQHLSIIIDTKEKIERAQETIKRGSYLTQSGATTKRSTGSCIYCKRNNHRSTECRTIPLQERTAFLTRNQLCHNCAKPNHRTEDCRSPGCFKCGRKHHSSLCFRNQQTQNRPYPAQERVMQPNSQPLPRNQNQANSMQRQVRNRPQGIARQTSQNVVTFDGEERQSGPQEDSHVNHVRGRKTQKTGTLLLTGTTTIQGPKVAKEVHVLMDTGSELSFIDSKLVDELELPVKGNTTLRLKTFGAESTKESTHRIVQVNLVDNEGKNYTCELLDTPVITTKSSNIQLTREDMDFIEDHGLSLSSRPGDSRQPQILLGCDHLWEMVEGKKCQLPSGIHLIDTKFGHMVSGRQSLSKPERTYEVQQVHNEMDTWDKYWSMESAGVNEYTGPEKTEKQLTEERIMKKFKETIVKKDDGYYVHLPWKEDHPHLPDNKRIAVARLRNLLKQYHNQPYLLQDFQKIFEDQLEKGIIEEVTPEMNRTITPNTIVHYLAYQAVFTPEKKTTPKRVVFDASAHYSGEPSLNEVLHQGPLILPNLNGMLMRFRVGKIAMAADIEKAFLQVRLHERDRDATRFLWVKDVSKALEENNIVTYRFTRVTFGLNSSPFLLAATISFHLETSTYDPKTKTEVMNNLYVDNLLLTTETREEAYHRYREAKKIFNDLNMNMREFVSNDLQVMAQFDDKDRSTTSPSKILGITWEATEDNLIAKCEVALPKAITKRSVLHTIASVYDPLCWLTPLMIGSKQFFQSLWTKQYKWDDPLSKEDQEAWKKLYTSIAGFRKRITRQIASKDNSHQLIAFSDASTRAMAACIYIKRYERHWLVQGKTKLPSLKATHTVPKLELNALTMAARLTLSTYEELKKTTTINAAYLLTDSEIALSWLKDVGETKITGVLVANRVREIRRITERLQSEGVKVHFGHVNTTWNPADCATRGLNADQLMDHFWWKGPPFLSLDKEAWPEGTRLFQHTTQPKEIIQISIASPQDAIIDWTRFNTVTKLKRTVANVLGFLRKSLQNLPVESKARIKKAIEIYEKEDNPSTITSVTLKNAWGWILRFHQSENNQMITSNFQKKLNMNQDDKGIWRCYGRLGKSLLPEDAKNPIFIAPNSKLAQMIIQEAHGKLHRSTAHTMLEVRQKFWIPKLRQQVKKTLKKCVQCQKWNNLPFRYPPLAQLPSRRVIRSYPFKDVGLDLFGPLRSRNTEGIQTKAYGCIFTCATTRLIHIELITDNSTTSFINAMRRFMSRRGVPNSLTCDNAPAFLLAEQILTNQSKEGHWEDPLDTFMANTGIKWMKITPYAPWQGGFYERLIKDVKLSLKKAIGRKVLGEDELRTTLTEIEGCLNNRPLTYQEENLDDIEFIRPIDFIHKQITVSYPMANSQDNNEDPNFLLPEEVHQLRTRSQTEQALQSSFRVTERFWELWNNAYLTSLREQHNTHLDQGRSTPKKPKEGQVVLLHDPFLPRNAWRMGRITRLLPASDGEIRTVELQMSNRKVTKRPVNLLVPLEISQDEDQQQDESIPQTSLESDSSHNTAIPTQENRTQNRPKRNTPKNYPYSQQEYEIYVTYQEDDQINTQEKENSTTIRYRMDARQATKRLFQDMSMRTRSMFEEAEVQRRLDCIYEDMSQLLESAEDLTFKFQQMKTTIAQQNPPPNARQFHQDLTKVYYDLQAVQLKMSNNIAVGELLWEIYEMLTEAELATKESRRRYEDKERTANRPHNRVANRMILMKECERINEIVEEVEKVKLEAFEEEPRESEFLEKFDHIQRALHDATSSLEALTLRTRRTEAMIYDKLVKPETALEKAVKNCEEKIEAKINSIEDNFHKMMEKIEAIAKENQGPPAAKRKKFQEDDGVPHRILTAKNKLKNLATCPERKLGSSTTLTQKNARDICVFCDAKGTHKPDACPIVTTIDQRMMVVRKKKICKYCLAKHESPCLRRAKCLYCCMANHHTSLCYLPEERALLQAIIDDWEVHNPNQQGTCEGRECARSEH